MSFSIEFYAKNTDVVEILKKEHVPDCVKEFVTEAATGFAPDVVLHVRAVGHLYDGHSFNISNADIKVVPIHLKSAPQGS